MRRCGPLRPFSAKSGRKVRDSVLLRTLRRPRLAPRRLRKALSWRFPSHPSEAHGAGRAKVLIELFRQSTKEPIYLTKNGSAALVIMDADAFDHEMSVHHDVLEREDRVFRAIMRGREDELAGRTRSFEQAREDARRLRENHG